MLLRLFDREGMQLIPSLEFAAPLPELEAIRRGGGPRGRSHRVDRPGRKPWCAVASAAARTGAVLQRARIRACRRPCSAVLRGGCPSATPGIRRLPGMAIRLSADGYAQLPGPEWGLDDATIAAFERDAKAPRARRRPGSLRPASRVSRPRAASPSVARVARGPVEQILPEGARTMLAASDPTAACIWPAPRSSAAKESQTDLKPALSRHTTMADLYLNAGIDAKNFQANRQLVFLRPERLAPGGNLAAKAAELEIGQMPDVERYFQGLPVAGSLFFHVPREIHIPSFDQKSPIKPSYTWLGFAAVAVGRSKIAAASSTIWPRSTRKPMFDGGWLLPMGQEDAIREPGGRIPLVAGRAVPAGRPIGNRRRSRSPSARERTANRTYLYAVNDAPFRVTARIHVETQSGCRLEELTGLRKVPPLKSDPEGGMYWEIQLEPYDLVAVAAKLKPNVAGLRVRKSLCRKRSSRPWSARSASWASGRPPCAIRRPWTCWKIPTSKNPPTPRKGIPGWSATSCDGVSVQLDSSSRPRRQAVGAHRQHTGRWPALVSRPLPAPTTGRVSMSVWLRIADPNKQPPLRLALEGKLNGRDKYSFAPVGRAARRIARRRELVQPMGPIHFPGRRSAAGRPVVAAGKIRPDGAGRSLGRRRATVQSGLQPAGNHRTLETHHPGRRETAETARSTIACTCWKAIGRASWTKTSACPWKIQSPRNPPPAWPISPPRRLPPPKSPPPKIPIAPAGSTA